MSDDDVEIVDEFHVWEPGWEEKLANLPLRKLGYWIPINIREGRLNNLSDLAIGEAQGGDLGRALADQARRNLAALDELEKGSGDAVTVTVTVNPPASET